MAGVTYEELLGIQKKREEKLQEATKKTTGTTASASKANSSSSGKASTKPYAQQLIENNIAPYKVVSRNVNNGFTAPNVNNGFIAPITKAKPTVTAKSYFDDGYDFGDITKTILRTSIKTTSSVANKTSNAISSAFSKIGSNSYSAFDNSLIQKYSSMSLSQIEKELDRVEKEEKLFKETNGGKFYNYISKAGASANVGADASGTAMTARERAKANIDTLNDYTREKEILGMLRKQKAIEEHLGDLSKEQLQMLDNIAEAESIDDAAPFFYMSADAKYSDPSSYYKMTDSERQLGESSKKKLFEQLKGENPGKSDEELNELIDELVELRSNQRNAEQQASESAQIGELATEHPVAAFLLSRGANLAGGMVALTELFYQRGNEYGLDVNAPGFSLANTSTAIDEQIQLDHDWKIGEVDAFDLFYKVGTGVVDNVARLAASGGNTAGAAAMMFTQGTTQAIIQGKKKGYSDSKALALGLLDGTFEAVSEKLSLDAVLGSKGGVLKKLAKSFAAEGSEEVTSNWMNRIADEIANGNHSELSKMYEAFKAKGYTDSQALAEVVLSVVGEDVESFVVGGFSGLALGGGNIAVNAVSNVIQQNAPVELDEKSQQVVDKVVEARIEQEKQDGKKVTKSTEKKIRDEVIRDLQKGYLGKDSIYSEFGGEDYENYKKVKDLTDENIANGKKVIENLKNEKKRLQAEYDALYKMKNGDKSDEQIDRQHTLKVRIAEIDGRIEQTESIIENLGKDERLTDLEAKLDANVYELVKDSKLAETFREGDRRRERFSADTGQYKDEYAKKTVQNAIDYGVNTEYGFNNTNATHDFVDFAAKIASDKKVEIVFTNTEGLTKLKEGDNEYNITADPNKINAFISEEHNKMFINMDTNKSLQSLVGHEITHTTEKAKSYDSVADLVKSILGEEEFSKLVEKKTETYKNLNLSKEDIEKEVVADFIGDRLFTDYDFIKRLSVEHRNIFQQIWDEIKYLCKVATTGSKELRELEKLKHQFEKAYKESAKSGVKVEGVKYDIREAVNGDKYVNISPDAIDVNNGKSIASNIAAVLQNKFNNLILVNGQFVRVNATTNKEFRGSDWALGLKAEHPDWFDDKIQAIANADEILKAAKNWINQKPKHPRDDKITSFGHGEILYKVGDNGYSAEVIVGVRDDGSAILYDIIRIVDKKIVDSSNVSKGKSLSGIAESTTDILPQNSEKSSGNVDYSLGEQEVQAVNTKLNEVGYSLDAKSGTVSYSLNSLEEAFSYKTDKNGVLLTENDYLKARNEYVTALANSIAAEKGKPTREEYKKADRYLDSLFLIHDLIASDRDRLDYEAAPGRKAWVGNTEYGGSIDFSTLCAKRRIFTGTFDAIQNALPDTVLTDKDFLNIRKLLLEHGEESPCSMCYVEGSRAKHGQYVDKWLKEYLKTNPEWKPQIADFTSTTRLEQTRIQHPEAYAAYVQAMNKLSQRKPKEASVRTDYKGEILDVFENGESVEQKNLNGGIRFNSFSDFEIIHALDCMQVLTDMSRVGLNGQAYTKVKEFAEAFGNTGLKINLSLVAKDVDANGKLVMDEVNGMNYAEAKDIRSRYSDNVGTVIVVFNDEQLKAALSDDTIDFVLPFHRSQWKKSQYALMGLPNVTRDYTNIQNDRYKNPKTGRAKKVPDGNIMPNEYWDFNLSGRENAQRYLDYINENSYIPKFDFLLNKVDGKWVLPDDAVGDGYFKLLIDFKMYNNEGVGSPQNPVLPEFNMPYIQQMLENYKGGHQAFPVANDVVDEFVEGKKSGRYSLSDEGETSKQYGNFNTYAKDITLQRDIAPTAEAQPVAEDVATDQTAPIQESVAPVMEEPIAPMTEEPVAEETVAPMVEEPVAEVETPTVPEVETPGVTAQEEVAPASEDVTPQQTEATPDVEPYIKKAAEKMLDDLKKSDRGKYTFDPELYYKTGGKEGESYVGRKTSAEITELLDKGYDFLDIEEGLKAITGVDTLYGKAVNDIKPILERMLREGYTDFISGEAVQPDQDYLNLFAPNQEAVAPTIEENVAPVAPESSVAPEAESPATPVQDDVAPLKETAQPKMPKTEAPKVAQSTSKVETPKATAPKTESFDAPVRETKKATESSGGEKIIGEEQLGTKEPTTKKGLWSDFVRNFVSKDSVFETLSLKTKNRALEDKLKMWRNRSDAKAQYFMENGKGDVKSLKSIVDTVQKSGLEKEFDLYMKHRLNVDRMKVDKPVFGYDVTADMSMQTAIDLQTKHPEFAQWAMDVYKYNDYLRDMMVDAGIISKETAALWAKQYPNYIPLERLTDDGKLVSGDGVGISAPVKKATGGNTGMEYLLKTMAHRTSQVFKAVAKNDFGVELKNTLKSDAEVSEATTGEAIEDLSTFDEGLLQAGVGGKSPTFTVFENGQRVTFEINEEMFKALQPTSEGLTRTVKPLNVASSLHKKVLTEYNLFFTARNFPKDAQDVIFNSKHAAKTYANMPVAVAELLKGKGKYVTEYWENGGESNTYFDSKENDFFEEDGALKKVLGFVPNGISKVNDFVEAIPRLAEYIASRKSGATIEAAMLDSARVTTDFSDGGDVTKFMNRNGFTFLNASVQGAAQQVRNIRQAKAEGFKGVAKLVGKYAAAGLPALLFNSIFWDDDEEYEELSEYVKDNYYVIAKYGDGQFVRIPKGRMAAVVQEVADQAYGILTGEVTGWDGAKDSGKAIYESVMNNIAPSNPIENNVIAPIIQTATNKTWYGEDLVPARLQDVPAREQYDETIDSISKWLGEHTGISPYKINYLLNQYSGFVGDMVLPGLTPEAERGDTSALGNLIAPLKDQFVVDAVIKNRNPSDFFSLSDELEVKANSKDATDEDKLKQKYISSVSYELSDLYKQKREIQGSNLSDDLKYKQVRDIQEQINELAKEGLESFDTVKIDKKYATVGGVGYKLNDEGEWQKITDEQLEKQNDAIDILGITPGQYWNDKDTYDMKAFYPEKYEVLQQEGISVAEYKEKYEQWIHLPNDDISWAANNPDKYTFSKVIMDNVVDYRAMTSELYAIRADKDENGNSISGTAKSKKQEYIWGLDIDEVQKYILFKNEYNTYDDHDQEIVDYILGRDDLSVDERKTILEAVGFTIDADGTIRD